jgi:hypothetical protein
LSDIIWKTLVYQGQTFERFEVSTDGQMRNANTKNIYKTFVNPNGYEQICVSLGSRNKKKIFKIHKAIAETFVPNPYNKPEVNHEDGNKLNNNVNNLAWATGSENTQHAYDNGLANALCGIDNPCAKLTKEDVMYIREYYMPYDSMYGARALGRKFGVNKNVIRDIANNKSYVNV